MTITIVHVLWLALLPLGLAAQPAGLPAPDSTQRLNPNIQVVGRLNNVGGRTGELPVPSLYRGLVFTDGGSLRYTDAAGNTFTEVETPPTFTLQQALNVRATPKGLAFDFQDATLNGTLFYGLMDSTPLNPLPVLYKSGVPIVGGKAEIDLNVFLQKADFAGVRQRGSGRVVYRIVRADGLILYDGRLHVQLPNRQSAALPEYRLLPSIVEGPTLHCVASDSITVAFRTLNEELCAVQVRGGGIEATVRESTPRMVHELTLRNLKPATEYTYTVQVGTYRETHTFRTAPKPGERTPFTFAMCADSRFNAGGGERRVLNVNAHIVAREFALARSRNAAFLQWSGDLIEGYQTHNAWGELHLEYANWKRALEPYASDMPYFVCMGNHELLMRVLKGPDGRSHQLDAFAPSARTRWSMSAEEQFSNQTVNPRNGPPAEDGTALDPNPTQPGDFPPYGETAFHYRYGNVAMVCLNSNYLYSPSLPEDSTGPGGNPHGYLMDGQLEWLHQTLNTYEADPTIDHVFVTLHTPLFPNGGHAEDDMWYNGNNQVRPCIAGKWAVQGILERRDSLIDLCINRTRKVRGFLSGDEHNYHRMNVDDAMPRYPTGWNGPRVRISRPFWHITNGAAGSPYYAQQQLPWSGYVRFFTVQHTLLLFHVSGPNIRVEAVNPESLLRIEEFGL